jgi:hypothetical protein
VLDEQGKLLFIGHFREAVEKAANTTGKRWTISQKLGACIPGQDKMPDGQRWLKSCGLPIHGNQASCQALSGLWLANSNAPLLMPRKRARWKRITS